MKVKETSRQAHESIKAAKAYYHEKIYSGLEILKVGGTFAEIAMAVGLAPEKIWKRLSECQRAGKIFDTGLTRKLPSGRKGTVWQLTYLPTVDPSNPITDQQITDLKNAGIPIGGVIKSIEPMGKVDEDAAFKKELWIMQTVSQSKLFQ